MVDSPFVTVVLPTLNEAGYIETCLRTLLDDPFPRDRLEVFVVDGGSSDGTRAIVERLRSEFPFVRLLDNPKRLQGAAFNLALTKRTHAPNGSCGAMPTHATRKVFLRGASRQAQRTTLTW